MTPDGFDDELARRIWQAKYRHGAEASIEATWARVARAVASAEQDAAGWAERFHELLRGFRFLPGGRILAGAGAGPGVTLFNCFVMGVVEDSPAGIARAVAEGESTLSQGGGVGYDVSPLAPAGVVGPGPLGLLDALDAMCARLTGTGGRRGAMMGTLRCDHPDILSFVEAKRDPARLRHFNLSVQVSDAFMAAVEGGAMWALVPPGGRGTARCLPARELWQRILRAAYDCAEPGVLFVDRINASNSLAYAEYLSATNPCGEVPLPPYGACNLGSFNLPAFVREPFTSHASLDLAGLEAWVPVAVRFLDDVYEIAAFPLPAQRDKALSSRRLGLGVTGLADALAMLGIPYGSAAACRLADEVMAHICRAAYEASVALSREKGAFPLFRAESFLAAGFAAGLPEPLRAAIRREGLRNSHLLAIAPAGSISLLAGNVSSGMEPIFDFTVQRRVRFPHGEEAVSTEDYAYRLYRRLHGAAPLPDAFVTAREVAPSQHLAMQAALQRHVDNAISKTVNLPPSASFEAFSAVYTEAWRLGLKGCTVFRPNPVTGEILSAGQGCCGGRKMARGAVSTPPELS